MRVALVIERMDTSRGGKEKSTAQIASQLARRGCDVTILCQAGSWDGQDVRVTELHKRGILRFRALTNFARDVRRQIEVGNYDVVHSMLPIPGANVYQPRGGTVPGQREGGYRRKSPWEHPITVLTDRLNFRRRVMEHLERTVVADNGCLCVALSQMVADEFDRYYDRRARVRVIRNAVDVPDPQDPQRKEHRQRKRFELGVGQGDLVMLTVAHNFALKGVRETIDAFAKWHHSARPQGINTRLVIVGKDLVEGYQRIAGMRGVGAEVVFAPPTEDVFQWYAACDVCVLLSWYDPCSRVVLEALRWGIPSITTVFNGACELIGQGAGIVVNSPRDTAGIVDAMSVISDGKKRAEMADACRKVTGEITIERHVDELLKAYAEVTGKR